MNTFSLKLQTPYQALVCGPTMSGKSTFVHNLLKHQNEICCPPAQKILYCYAAYQDNFEKLKQTCPGIIFIEGLPPKENEFWNENRNSILVLDDLATQLFKDSSISNLVTVKSHHYGISVIIICQTLFPRGSESRLISLNTCYLICMKNPRDQRQINLLSSQISPQNSKRIVDAYRMATSLPYTYLMIDLKQETPELLRLRSNILPSEAPMHIYTD